MKTPKGGEMIFHPFKICNYNILGGGGGGAAIVVKRPSTQVLLLGEQNITISQHIENATKSYVHCTPLLNKNGI